MVGINATFLVILLSGCAKNKSCVFVFDTEFGDIGSVNIVRDKGSRENKGFAFVRYRKVSSAALAIEHCDKSKLHLLTFFL